MKLFSNLTFALVVLVIGGAHNHRWRDVYEILQDDVNGLKYGSPSRMPGALCRRHHVTIALVDTYIAIGVDLASLGNCESDFGIEGIYNIGTKALLRGTTPNAVKTFEHHKFGKIKIGFFDVMYDIKDSSKGLHWTDPLAAAKQQVKLLKDQSVDTIIALTHQTLADTNRLSKEVTDVNLIYGGHDHTLMLQTNYCTPYLKPDFDFRSIGRLDWNISLQMASDHAFDHVVADYTTKIAILHARVIGTLCETLDVTNRLVRTADVPVGAIFSNASLAFYGPGNADVAVTNGGGIRTDTTYPASSLTIGQVIGRSPFANTLTVIEIDVVSLQVSRARNRCELRGQLGVGKITSIEWFKHPTRTGPVLDTDVFTLVLIAFPFNTEFMTMPGAIVNKVFVNGAEAGRMDTALETYTKVLPDANVCVKAEGRSIVTF
ncbi:Calcineurin-like phosphoesterase, partial [Globisporangium splendens]